MAGQVVTRLINAGAVSTKGVELDLGAQASCNVNGTALPFSSTFRANVSADYRHPLPLGPELELYANYFWQTREQFSLPASTATEQGAYGIMNASVALNFDDGWRVALVGKNLLNKSYLAAMATGTG